MRKEARIRSRGRQLLRTGRLAVGLRILACFASVFGASVLVSVGHQRGTIWISNGLLLTYLLLAPKKRWHFYLAAGFAAELLSALLTHYGSIGIAFTNAAFNVGEALTAALLLQMPKARPPRFTDRVYLVRFLWWAVVVAPTVTGIAVVATAAAFWHPDPWALLQRWIICDGLGIAVATPAFSAIFQSRFKETLRSTDAMIYPALLIAVTFASLQWSKIPTLTLIFPILVVILLRLGLGWGALGTLAVAAIGNWYAMHVPIGSHGFVMSPLDTGLRMQVFVASAMFVLYTVSVVLENLRSTERKLREIVGVHELVTQNSRDVILLADLDGVPHYISPAVYGMTGWKPEEALHRGFAETVHPEDLPKIQTMIERLRSEAKSGAIQYRAARRKGGYIWVEGNLHAVEDAHSKGHSGILGIVRDISERKRSEEKLQSAYRAMEAMAVVDALTGVANRRRFDEALSVEWRRGLRDRRPLGLVLLDVDMFKSYNDTYGHVRGDSCLKQVAESALDAVTRPGDLVARYGGEEFAIILPNTDEQGAITIGAEVCSALRSRMVPHDGSPYKIVTVSVGCASLVPEFGHRAPELIEMADQALYMAKRSGRNRVYGNHEALEAAVIQDDQGNIIGMR